MTIYSDKTSLKNNWPWWRFAITALAIFALILSLLMSWHYLTGGSMIGCDGGSPCDQVMSSKWSTIAGILPVSGLAVGAYLTVIMSSFFIGQATEASIRRLAWQVMLILAGAIAGSAIWFTGIQKWSIGEFCPYCMATHSIGFLMSLLIFWEAIKESNVDLAPISNTKQETTNKNITLSFLEQNSGKMRKILLLLGGLASSGILATSQLLFNPSSTSRTGKSQGNNITIDYKSAPMIGSTEAPYIINLLFDYKCPHCQRIHFMLDEVVRRYSGKVAFALCPVPLNPHCNPYIPREAEEFKNACELAQISMAVWLANPKAFRDFENWMFTYDSGDRWHPRTLEEALSKAAELIGKAKLDAGLSAPWTSSYIQTCVQIYGQTLQSGKGGVPRMVLGSQWVIPEVSSSDQLVQILGKNLGIPKP